MQNSTVVLGKDEAGWTQVTPQTHALHVDVEISAEENKLVFVRKNFLVCGEKSFSMPVGKTHEHRLEWDEAEVTLSPIWEALWGAIKSMLSAKGQSCQTSGLEAIRRRARAVWVSRYKVGTQEIRFIRGIGRSVHRWFLDVGASPYRVSIKGSPTVLGSDTNTVLGCSKHGIVWILTGLVLDIEDKDRRKWVMKDLLKLPPTHLMELFVRLYRNMPMNLYRRYHPGSVSAMWYPRDNSCVSYKGQKAPYRALKEEGTPESETPSDEDVCGLVQEAVRQCYFGPTLKPWTIGSVRVPGRKAGNDIPDTPWHALLLHNIGDLCMLTIGAGKLDDCADEEKDSVLALIKKEDAVRWVSASKPSDLLPLGMNILAPGKNLTHYEYELITKDKALDWDNPLNGWFRNVDKLMPDRFQYEPDGKRKLQGLERGFFSYTGDGSNWATTRYFLREAISFIKDGQRVYEVYAGIVGTDSTGRQVKAQPIKGSLSRMVKDAKYNHNIERHLIAAKLLQEDSAQASQPLWQPEPDCPLLHNKELEDRRIKSKRHLILLGQALRHCVGTRADSKNTLFYWDGNTVVAQVSTGPDRSKHLIDLQKTWNVDLSEFGTRFWHLQECRDYHNTTTEASESFSSFIRSRLAYSELSVSTDVGQERQKNDPTEWDIKGAEDPTIEEDGAEDELYANLETKKDLSNIKYHLSRNLVDCQFRVLLDGSQEGYVVGSIAYNITWSSDSCTVLKILKSEPTSDDAFQTAGQLSDANTILVADSEFEVFRFEGGKPVKDMTRLSEADEECDCEEVTLDKLP